MSAAEAAVAPPVVASSENSTRGHSRFRGRGRGGPGRGSHSGRGRGHGRGQGRDGTNEASGVALSDATEMQVAQQSQQPLRNQTQRQPRQNRHREQTQNAPTEGNTPTTTSIDRPPRRRNRKPANTHPHERPPTQVGGRAFGGRLTRGDAPTANDSSQPPATTDNEPDQLHADVPEFVPGQVQAHHVRDSKYRPQPVKKAHDHPPKVTTKSAAPDIATRTHEDIANGLYECPICTSELGRKSRIWSCSLCWTVFHLSCVKKWFSECGAALDVTFLTMFFQQTIPVGAKRRLILDPYREFLLTPVDKPALEVESDALILAIQPVTQVLAHHVPLWDRHKTVFAERIQQQSDVLTRIILMVGVVERFVATCSLVVRTLVRGLVTRDFADLAKKKSMSAATVGKSRIRFCVAPPKRK
ncbi:hypothetical protein EYB25_003889 [Talaromyces marneffei]|nr:hypothetical protein EYB25_003889 [Talaromyces marneffei]